jgi:peptide methionine sulfoxide reductase MsrA
MKIKLMLLWIFSGINCTKGIRKIDCDGNHVSPDFPAEGYHQNYFKQHPNQGYCAFVVAPKGRRVPKNISWPL